MRDRSVIVVERSMVMISHAIAVAIRRGEKRITRLSLRHHSTHDEATLYYMFMDDVVNGFARQYMPTNGKVACNMIREP